ncbi:MAG: N-acetyltransferase [Calditrichaeota bacterium]|nr:GNAT family N-acetyltransferase [Calditrichota bacterium]RQW08031.1 MAG: N-acetyltransferase [Calditrichota bacterium]
MLQMRKMIPKDRAAIYEILQQTDMFTLPEIKVAMELIDIYLFNKDQNDYIIDVGVTEQNEIAGYICYGPTPATEGTYDIYWIAVAPNLQKKGIGKQMLDFAEEQIIRLNGRIIVIETSSQSKYSPTQQFYLKNNYQLEARIRDFYRPSDDRLIFTKRFEKKPNGGKQENGKMATAVTE